MILINNINAQKFTLNGVPYFKNFTPVKVGNDKIKIVNVYDSRLVLSEALLISEFTVDGIVYDNLPDLQGALLPVLFTRDTLGGGNINQYDAILAAPEIISGVGNTYTFPIGFSWRINNSLYGNISPIIRTINTAEEGFKRIDIAVLNTSNDIVIVEGTPDEDTAVEPNTPPNTLLLTRWLITGDVISEPETPVLDGYIAKSEYAEQNIATPGEITVALETQETAFNLLSDDTIKLLGTAPNSGYLSTIYRTGKKVSFANLSATNKIIKHSTDAHGFRLPNAQDFVLKPKEKIIFSQTKKDGNYYLELDSVNRVGLATSEDLDNAITALEQNSYKTISANTSLDDSYHNATVWVTATCNITIPSGLRADFACNLKTFTGVIGTYLTSGTTISSQSDGTVQAEKSMVHLVQYTTNVFILSGGGLT